MTHRPAPDLPPAQARKAQQPRLRRQAIQGGLAQPSRRHDLEDKQR